MGAGDILPERPPGAAGKGHQRYPFPKFHSEAICGIQRHFQVGPQISLHDVLTVASPSATCGHAVFVLVLPFVPVWIHMLNNSVASGVTTGSHGGENCRSGLSILLSAHSSSSMPFRFYSGGSFLGGSKQGNRAHGLTMALILPFSDSTFLLTLPGWPTPSVLS